MFKTSGVPSHDFAEHSCISIHRSTSNVAVITLPFPIRQLQEDHNGFGNFLLLQTGKTTKTQLATWPTTCSPPIHRLSSDSVVLLFRSAASPGLPLVLPQWNHNLWNPFLLFHQNDRSGPASLLFSFCHFLGLSKSGTVVETPRNN